jgi:hypothetical protein
MCIKYFSSSLLSFYRWYKIPLRVPACDRPDTEENGNIEGSSGVIVGEKHPLPL